MFYSFVHAGSGSFSEQGMAFCLVQRILDFDVLPRIVECCADDMVMM